MKGSETDLLNSGKRDKVEIMAAIISLTGEFSTKTSIMNRVNLSHKQLTRYLKIMAAKQLIKTSKVKGKTLYQQTEKGRKFFNIYCEMLKILYGDNLLKVHNNLVVECLEQNHEYH